MGGGGGGGGANESAQDQCQLLAIENLIVVK